LPEDTIIEIAKFWAKYDFIELDEAQRKVRILEDTRRLFLAETELTLVVKGGIKSLRMDEGRLVMEGSGLSVEWRREEEFPISRSLILASVKKHLKVLKYLSTSNDWFTIQSLLEELSIGKRELMNILNLLEKHGFIVYDMKKEKVRYALIQ
jgi:hypothetical protein